MNALLSPSCNLTNFEQGPPQGPPTPPHPVSFCTEPAAAPAGSVGVASLRCRRKQPPTSQWLGQQWVISHPRCRCFPDSGWWRRHCPQRHRSRGRGKKDSRGSHPGRNCSGPEGTDGMVTATRWPALVSDPTQPQGPGRAAATRGSARGRTGDLW